MPPGGWGPLKQVRWVSPQAQPHTAFLLAGSEGSPRWDGGA